MPSPSAGVLVLQPSVAVLNSCQLSCFSAEFSQAEQYSIVFCQMRCACGHRSPKTVSSDDAGDECGDVCYQGSSSSAVAASGLHLQPHEPTHFLQNIPWTGQKNLPQRRCKICKEKGMRQMTCFFCPSCPEQPAFCRIRDCFVKYHAVMGFPFLPPVINTGQLSS